MKYKNIKNIFVYCTTVQWRTLKYLIVLYHIGNKNLFKTCKYLLFCTVCLLGMFQHWSTEALDNSNKELLEAVVDDSLLNSYLISRDGISSHYGHKFHNRLTANGERFDLFEFTAAHKTLPFGTIVKVTHQENAQVTLVRINDRGPFVKGRIIDLSYIAAKNINGLGTPNVNIEYFDNDKLTDDLDSTYFIGYSLSHSPIIIKEEFVDVIDSTTDWGGAVNTYMYEEKEEPNNYIFIRNIKSSNTTTYFIGKVDVNDT